MTVASQDRVVPERWVRYDVLLIGIRHPTSQQPSPRSAVVDKHGKGNRCQQQHRVIWE